MRILNAPHLLAGGAGHFKMYTIWRNRYRFIEIKIIYWTHRMYPKIITNFGSQGAIYVGDWDQNCLFVQYFCHAGHFKMYLICRHLDRLIEFQNLYQTHKISPKLINAA